MNGYDLKGQRFGRWTVLSFSHQNSRKNNMWLCRCDCGTERTVTARSLKNGRSASCGCGRSVKAAISPGLHRHPLYPSWIQMKGRCYNTNHLEYPNYGARGIYVCERWRNNFAQFLEDVGERPKNHTLDRIDNDGPYSPDNCRWATLSTQARNTRQAHHLEYDGKKMTVVEWATELNMSPATLYTRLRLGWSDERVLTHEIDTRCHHKSIE